MKRLLEFVIYHPWSLSPIALYHATVSIIYWALPRNAFTLLIICAVFHEAFSLLFKLLVKASVLARDRFVYFPYRETNAIIKQCLFFIPFYEI